MKLEPSISPASTPLRVRAWTNLCDDEADDPSSGQYTMQTMPPGQSLDALHATVEELFTFGWRCDNPRAPEKAVRNGCALSDMPEME